MDQQDKLQVVLMMFNGLHEPWTASPESWHLSRIYYNTILSHSHKWRVGGGGRKGVYVDSPNDNKALCATSTGPSGPSQMAIWQHPLTVTTARFGTGSAQTRNQEAIPGMTGTDPELGSPLRNGRHWVQRWRRGCPHHRVDNWRHHRR